MVRTVLACLLAVWSMLAVVSAPVAMAAAQPPPLKLSVTAPRTWGPKALLQDGDWSLDFRIRSTVAPAYFEVREAPLNFNLLVLSDPDDCLDLSAADPTQGPFTAGCPGGPDETFIRFTEDRLESPGVNDFGGCPEPFRSALTQTPLTDLLSQGGSIPFTEANVSYVRTRTGPSFHPFGPDTTNSAAADASDCYGMGADEDLPSLVVMADVGATQLFDTDLSYDRSRIRNLAGLVSGVGYELLDGQDNTAIVAELDIYGANEPRKVTSTLAPAIFVDLGDIFIEQGFTYTDPSFKYKVADGPVTTVKLSGVYEPAALLDAIQQEAAGPYSVTIRSVLVQGTAPNFIDDVNGDGKFTAWDLRQAGYTLLSNQTVTRLNLIPREALRVETQSFECPNNLTYTDLDGSGGFFGCDDGEGTSRSAIRVPR